MATPFKIVVYINGYRFDPIHVSATFAIEDVCHFQVEVPPVPHWDLLLPRSHGAVFFLDPNTDTYRLMCEGEYVGYARSKVGTGLRTRGLVFRGLHGFMEDATFVNMVGVMTSAADPPGGSGAANVAVSARANGSLISQGVKANPYRTVGVEQIFRNVAASGNVSSALLEIPRRLVAQTPVESFYFWARRMDRKMWTFIDIDLKAAMDYQRWSDVAVNTVNTMGLGPNTSLMSVVQRYEELAFYHHIAMPAPPLYKTNAVRIGEDLTGKDTSQAAQPQQQKLDVSYSFFVPEMFFKPYLYNTIPPACNTLFNDQLKSISGTLAFAAVPTRLIGQLAPPGAQLSAYPLLYMANDQFAVSNVSEQSANLAAMQQITHGMFSDEELIRGVKSQHEMLRFEKLQPSGGGDEKSRAPLPTTIDLLMRHEFNRARGQNRVLQITAVFQPYLVPGFPIVVEDGNQPFRAMVQSVTHSMSLDGQPTTSVVVTHVEELLQVGDASKTAPLPAYLNTIYTPAAIAATFKDLFGTNLLNDPNSEPFATCVPPTLINQALQSDKFAVGITRVEGYTSKTAQVNLDLLLSAVVDVPHYSDTGERVANVSLAGQSIANRLRLSAQPHEAFMQYQYRSGCSLRNWMIMHNLQTRTAADTEGIDRNPPMNLGNPLSTEGDDVFGHPSWLEMNKNPASLENFSFEFPQYGAYKATVRSAVLGSIGPQSIISPNRQQKTSAIQDAILRMATNDTKLAAEDNIAANAGATGDFNPPTPNTARQA